MLQIFPDGYIFLEASGLNQGNYAELIIPGGGTQLLTSGQAVCMTFWYHMHGSDVGSLTVDAQSRTTSQRVNVFTVGKLTSCVFAYATHTHL